MKRVYASEARKKIGQEIVITGFVETIRNQGKIVFLVVREISGKIQVVVSQKSEAFTLAKELTLESVIEVKGKVKKIPSASKKVEIEAKEIKILSVAKPELPIPVIEKAKGGVKRQKRLDWRWLDLRKPEKQLIFKVWTTLEQGFRGYWLSHDYLQIHSPKLMGTASESGSEVFEVKYFGKKAYLAQSPQFYKQMAMCAGFEKVFEVGPVFRANPSFTSKHDTEFTMYDIEISYINSHQEIMAEEEKAIAHALKKVKQKHGKEIEKIYRRKLVVPKTPFPQLTFKKAKKILKQIGVKSEKESDFSPEEERKIGEYIEKDKGHEFVFITEYPAQSRAFYHMRKKLDPKLTKGFDLLWKGLEITTGAQREHRIEILTKQAEEKGISPESIKHYLEFFKYGCPPHGGCAIGPTRMLMKIFGIDNVREVTFLYRGVKRLTP